MVPGVVGAAGAAAGQIAGPAGAGTVTTPVRCLVGRPARETHQRSPPPPATGTTAVQTRVTTWAATGGTEGPAVR